MSVAENKTEHCSHKKDIRAVVGLHDSIFEAGFNEEGGAVKLPHAVQEIESWERITESEGVKEA